jgi:dTDP-glucose 4,6-dehydratase
VARARGAERFLHVSTDEVYGSLGATGKFTEVRAPAHPERLDRSNVNARIGAT